MKRLTYGEQLAHPLWQKRRLEMLSAAGFKCQHCSDTESTLHVHHRKYRSGALAWEYEDHELVVLCETCHEAEHGKGLVVSAGEVRIMRSVIATLTERISQDEARLIEQRTLYFADPDPAFEAERARQLSVLQQRMAV